MAITLISTPGAADANTYESMAEANGYFATRLPLSIPWVASGDAEAQAMIMATRNIDALAQPLKIFVPTSSGGGYYRVRRAWTGSPATTTQRLAWPRLGMFDRNGNTISSTVIPQELKDAESEFAGLLKASGGSTGDTSTQGIQSLKAGSVAITFAAGTIAQPQTWPDTVLALLIPSWLTDEVIEVAGGSSIVEFSMLSGGG